MATQNYSDNLDYYMGSSSVLPPYNNSFNHTDLICEKSHARQFAQTFLPAFFSIVFCIGTVGNVSVILVYWTYRYRKSITDRYLLHLAIADQLLVFTLPFWAKAALYGWIFNNVMCKILNSMYKINFYSCMLFLTSISFDRYITIVHALKAKNSKRKRLLRSKLVCFGVWLIAIGLCIPEIVYSESKQVSNTTTCKMVYPTTVTRTTKVTVLALKITIGFLLPLLVMVTCYAFIIHTLLQAKRSQKHKSLKIIIVIITAFLLSQLPYNSILLVKIIDTYTRVIYDCKTSDNIDLGFQITQSIAFLHSCLNPFLYMFVGERFRKALFKTLGDLIHCTGKSREQSSSVYDSQEGSSKWSALLGPSKNRSSLTSSMHRNSSLTPNFGQAPFTVNGSLAGARSTECSAL
ncbi:C-C chemokine receptor type 9-like [Mauremys mutica]|uniref:C-C chemokine receptor type 9-like n=1 Tax=Mauremys mutica TaxID=74926 RepID=UPI001D16D4B9|nr:C-C chemokine receptor type 9-like [Mauremys mutica]XP_044861460.1 C-C chemokine receptor type 9-like [Mauremys mutica]